MGVTIIQYETRDDSRLNALMARNRSYAVKKGYEYIRFGPLQDLPAYWIKVNLVLMILRGAADGDIVGWVDSDAVIVDEETPIGDLFREAGAGIYFIGSRDPKPWTSPFNAGVFFVKANGVSRNLMEDWMDTYRPKNWTHLVDGSWKCSGPWAGDDYEQGAFVKTIMTSYKHAIKIYDSDKFNCVSPVYTDKRPNGGKVFSCHFAGNYKARIPDFILGNGHVRSVKMGDDDYTGLLTSRGFALAVAGLLIGAAAIWAFTKKESRSPAAAALSYMSGLVKSALP